MFRKVVSKLGELPPQRIPHRSCSSAVVNEGSLIAFLPLLSVPLGISVAVAGVKTYYKGKISILRKLLKDAEVDLEQVRKGKEKGLRKGEEQV